MINLQLVIQDAIASVNGVNQPSVLEGVGATTVKPTLPELAQAIDHTLLRLDATEAEIDKLCEEARTWNFKTVCVRLPFVARAVGNLQGSPVGVACVVGFHEGTYTTEEKLREAAAALNAGATELDVVLNHRLLVSAIQSPNSDVKNAESSSSLRQNIKLDTAALTTIQKELRQLRTFSAPLSTSTPQSNRPTLKLILETSALAPYSYPSLLIAATVLAHDAGFDFVKTSTGFTGDGARVQDVDIMKRTINWLELRDAAQNQNPNIGATGESRSGMQVKASGGIRTLADALNMMSVGATRLGVSAGIAILEEAQKATDEAIADDDGASRPPNSVDQSDQASNQSGGY